MGAVVGSIVALAVDTSANRLVGVDGSADPEFLIDVLPGGGDSTKIGPIGPTSVKGLAFDPNTETLYGVDAGTRELLILDRLTGAHTPVGALGFTKVRCLAFDPLTGTLYGVDAATDTLISIDSLTGAGTSIGPIGLPSNTNITGLAFDPGAGVLYGSNTTLRELVTIDMLTGTAAIVGPVGFDNVSGLTFDTNTNTLLGTSNDTNEVLAIDTGTGAATVLGSISASVFDTGAVYVFDAPLLSETYCTAGTSASGCQAMIGASGTPSATASTGFDLLVSGVEGQKAGLFFFGVNGRQANTWGNGTSFQCVVPPVTRGGLILAVGTIGSCNASYAYDLNARWAAKPGQNPGAGSLVGAQFWYRDAFNPLGPGTSISDAIQFSVAP